MTRALLSCVALAAFVAAASLCLFAVSPVEARSNGLLSSCDLSPIKVGQASWPYGKYGRNFTAGGANSGIMAWAAAPTPSLFYTIRSGDVGARSADPTKYIPGGTLNEIHLRVTDFRRKFIGLVLYATNTSAGTNGANMEQRVGSWSFPDTYPFLIPSETCGSSVVTHANADLKPIHTRFFFKAPVGTGTVRFRVLIKQAEQNKGYFFWPMVELKLTEGIAPTVPTIPAGVNATILPLVGDGETATVIGGAGLACAEACAAQSPIMPYCHKQATTDIKDVASLTTSITGRVACRTPLVAGCQFAGAAKIDGNGFCSFRSADIASTCPAAFNALNMSDPATYEPDVCFTKPLADSNNICICTNNKAAMGTVPAGQAANGGSGSGLNSAATSTVGANGAFVALFAAFAALASSTGSFKSSRSLLIAVACVALVLALATPTSAHNFIKSQHRANEASVTVPCQQRVGNQPHVQLVAGQWFEAEWAMGHGDSTPGPFYFMIVPLSEYDQLRAANITNIMKDYIALAPLSAYRNMSTDAVMWEKHHLRLSTEAAGDPLSTNVYFKESNLSSSDPSFIWRDDVYAQKLHPSSYTLANKAKWVQRRFTDEIVAKDKRVSYASAKYPWIESVDAFLNPFQEHNPYSGQSAMARFQVPARHGPGDYIAWFYWAGYKDCIDINIMSGTTPVKNRYGLNATVAAPTVLKLDHCEFTYVNQAQTKLRKLGPSLNATQCINDCIARGGSACSSVQVVRATNPAAVTQSYTVNIPFVPQYFNQTLQDLGVMFQPCDQLLVHERATNGCNRRPDANAMPAFMNNVAPDEYVCYGLLPQRNTANQVEEDHTITDEPSEPAFYSTCYQIIPAGGFLNTPPYVYQAPSWNVADACIACDFHAGINATAVPNWTAGLRLQDANGGCPDCSIVNAAGSVATLQPKLSGADVTTA